VVKSPCFVVLSAPCGRLDNSIRFVLGEDRGSKSSVCGFSLISSLHLFSLASCHSRVLLVSSVLVSFLVFVLFFSFPFFCFVREQVCSLLSGEDCDGAENFTCKFSVALAG